MILFLGSGVSLASNLPSVSEIKNELLNAKCDTRLLELLNLIIKLDSNYLIKSAPYKKSNGKYGFTGQIFRLETTYEDLFYLVDQIYINSIGLKADIMAESFTDLVRRKGRSFLNGKTKIENLIDLNKLAHDARTYIESQVANLLHTNVVNGLDLVVALARSPGISSLNIVTLNHDTLVEQLLKSKNIEFTDGFGCSDGDIRWFEDKFDDDSLIQIIKLHGSISWFLQGLDRILQPIIITDNNSTHWRNIKNASIKDIQKVPSFITGIGKVNSYNRGIFAAHHYRFLQTLHQNDTMIMSGYGWGDIPINFQLQNWLARDKGNTLILLHKNPTFLVENSLELRHIYDAYIKSRQIISIEKWLSETSLSEIEMYL